MHMDHLAQCQILNNSRTNVADDVDDDDDDDNGYNILIFFIYSRHFFKFLLCAKHSSRADVGKI